MQWSSSLKHEQQGESAYTRIFKEPLLQVSDDINEMVEQIQAIQIDISELAGRPISLVGGSKR